MTRTIVAGATVAGFALNPAWAAEAFGAAVVTVGMALAVRHWRQSRATRLAVGELWERIEGVRDTLAGTWWDEVVLFVPATLYLLNYVMTWCRVCGFLRTCIWCFAALVVVWLWTNRVKPTRMA